MRTQSLHPLLFVLLILPFFISCKDKTETAAPKPTTTPTEDPLFKKYELEKIKLPEGFHISVFAEVPNARSLALSPNGTLFVGNRDGDKVFAATDKNKDGRADSVYTIASGLNMPNGVAFRDGALYVAEINRILRFDNIENNLAHPPAYHVVYDKFPTDRSHGWKFIAFGPDGKLYVPVGAPCNICDPGLPYATITRMNPDGSGLEVYARGIRNTVGFTWHPQTQDLWFTDNGRDNMGDDMPSDELNVAPKQGLHFGYPYCHQGNTLDPEFGKGKNCADYVPPVQLMDAHVAALGLRFYTGTMFPAEYRNQLIIAQHGSWNRSTPSGYRLMLVKLDSNKAVSYTPFATGWLQNEKDVIGRPVDVQVMPDGSLLVSDDKKGAVYRITYQKS